MTEKNKEKGLNIIISTIVSVCIVLLTTSLNTGAITERDLKEKIDLKADVSYVDGQNKIQDLHNKRLETLFLFEVTELRKDLRLKTDKK